MASGYRPCSAPCTASQEPAARRLLALHNCVDPARVRFRVTGDGQGVLEFGVDLALLGDAFGGPAFETMVQREIAGVK